jgi:hypothetical protein
MEQRNAIALLLPLLFAQSASGQSGVTETVGPSDYGTFVSECRALVGDGKETQSQALLAATAAGMCLGRIVGYLDAAYIAANGDVWTFGLDDKRTCIFNRYSLNHALDERNTVKQAMYLAAIVARSNQTHYDVPWQRGLTVLLMQRYPCKTPRANTAELQSPRDVPATRERRNPRSVQR